MDEFARVFAHNFGTEDTAALRLGDDLHVAVVRVHENGFAVVVERIARGEVGRAGFVEFAFKAADGGELRVGEDDIEEERPIDGFDFFTPAAWRAASSPCWMATWTISTGPEQSPPA